MSSSKSNLGAGKQEDQNSLYGDEENPFKAPSDVLIFSFKETEKACT